MRSKKMITLATLIAIVALTLSIPMFASGCGDDDVAYQGKMAQQSQDRDGEGQRGGPMMGRAQGQNSGEDSICAGNSAGDVDGDGICEGKADCPGATGGGCDGDCLGTGNGSAGGSTDTVTSDTLPSCCQ